MCDYLFIYSHLAILISGNASIYAGQTATFTCRVDALGVTFQWARTNGEDVTFFNEDVDVETSDDDSNSTISTLNVTNVNYTDSNVGYYCNTSGNNISMIAYLTGIYI